VATSRSSHAGTAFINLAYVNSNGFGLVPVAAMHDPGSDPQLSRIYRLIEQPVIRHRSRISALPRRRVLPHMYPV
jgi:hypothetical protein